MSVTNTYIVTGMTCGHCVQAVSGELNQLPGVHDVQVDLTSGAVSVTSDGPLPIDEMSGRRRRGGLRARWLAGAPANG